VTVRLPQWGKKKKEPKRKRYHHTFIGVQNEAVRDSSKAEKHITISVRGVQGVASGSFKLAYQPGMKLGLYLKTLKLRRVGIYHSVYDLANKSHGKCRMSYVPEAGAEILIGPVNVGLATQWARTNIDAQRVAANMGGRKRQGRPQRS